MKDKTTGKYTIILTPKELDALEWYLIKNPCESGCVWEPHPKGYECDGCEFLELSESVKRKVWHEIYDK